MTDEELVLDDGRGPTLDVWTTDYRVFLEIRTGSTVGMSATDARHLAEMLLDALIEIGEESPDD
jgi:hypothetical protein